MEVANKNTSKVWLFDGKPEFVDLNVPQSDPGEGGYLLALELKTGTVRLAATRQPARFVSAWLKNVRRYNIPDIVRVLVSYPHIRYETMKRTVAGLLAEHKDAETEDFRVGVKVVTEKVRAVLEEVRR